jgi:GNAT superfamily N-acetyltransferase
MSVLVRTTQPADFGGIIDLCGRVYPHSAPWQVEQLASHHALFPEGQLVASDVESGRILGMAASLIVQWDDYESNESWRKFTDRGMFTNHDPVLGRTLYGAEIMVDPATQGRGVGSAIYHARRGICEQLGLLRIRAGARLRGYSQHAGNMTAREYVELVERSELRDPTLSFQLKRGFRVLDVVEGYLRSDPESLGYAAIIEWRNAAARAAGSPPGSAD